MHPYDPSYFDLETADLAYYCRGCKRTVRGIALTEPEPLVTRQTFEVVQAYLRRPGNPKYRKHNPLFKGMVRCSECRGTVAWEQQKGHWYGHCNGYRPCSQKGKKYMRQDKAEKQLTPIFEELRRLSPDVITKIRKDLQDSHAQEIVERDAAIAKLNLKISTINKLVRQVCSRLFSIT